MAKRLILIHGRSYKPAQAFFQQTWFDSIEHGLARDHGEAAVERFRAATPHFVYYGTESNRLLDKLGKGPYDEADDRISRQEALAALRSYSADELDGPRTERLYGDLPHANPFKEFLADISAGPLSLLGAAEPLIEWAAPDMAHYWDMDSAFGSAVRWKLTAPLAELLQQGHEVMIVSHSLGSLIAYDVLWKLSYYGEWNALWDRKVELWVTLGSPLGDPTVMKKLKGAGASGARRFPRNVRRLVNFAAEDDFICHDETLADDFDGMRQHHGTHLEDVHDIYSLAARRPGPGGSLRANPHHEPGYLVHPRFTRLLHDWLTR